MPGGSPGAPPGPRPVFTNEQFEDITGRIRDPPDSEAAPKRLRTGGGYLHDVSQKSVVESKLVANITLLTDDKSAFRQWDAKMVNALSHLRPGYGKALEKLKEILDQGRDPEDVKPGATTRQMSPVSGATLADMVLVQCEYEFVDID